MNDEFGTALRDRLDDLAAFGTPDERPPLDSLDAVQLAPVGDAPRHGATSTRWLAAAVAVVLLIGAAAVLVEVTNNDDGQAVATDPTVDRDDAMTTQMTTLDDGTPIPLDGLPVGEDVPFTVETPDGTVAGSMHRTLGVDGRGTGFCANFSYAGVCYGGTGGHWNNRPFLAGLGGSSVNSIPQERGMIWLLPDDVDELVIEWDDGTTAVLSVAHPIEGLPGVTGMRIPGNVRGGTATGGGTSVPFAAPLHEPRAVELEAMPEATVPAPSDGVHFGRLDEFFDDGTDATIRVRPGQYFGGDEAEAAAAEDGKGPLGNPFYIRQDVGPPVVLRVDRSRVRPTVVDGAWIQPVGVSWDDYVAHLRGDDPFPIYWAGTFVEYTISDGVVVSLDEIYLP